MSDPVAPSPLVLGAGEVHTRWPFVGADAVVLTGGTFGPPLVRDTRITKVGKRDIVTEAGDRFNADHRHRSGDRWSRDQLCAPDDPTVIEAVQQGRRVAAIAEARNAVEDAVACFRGSSRYTNPTPALPHLRRAIDLIEKIGPES